MTSRLSPRRNVHRFGDEELVALHPFDDHFFALHRLEHFVAHARAVVAAKPQSLALGGDEKRLVLASALGVPAPRPNLDAALSTHASIVRRASG